MTFPVPDKSNLIVVKGESIKELDEKTKLFKGWVIASKIMPWVDNEGFIWLVRILTRPLYLLGFDGVTVIGYN